MYTSCASLFISSFTGFGGGGGGVTTLGCGGGGGDVSHATSMQSASADKRAAKIGALRFIRGSAKEGRATCGANETNHIAGYCDRRESAKRRTLCAVSSYGDGKSRVAAYASAGRY